MIRHKAFTIIELLVVLVIIGMLIAAASLSFGAAEKTGRDSRRMSDILLIGKAVDTAYSANNAYPGNQRMDGSNSVPLTMNRSSAMCAQDINSDAPTVPISLSSFTNGTIPRDPSPYVADASHNPTGEFCVYPTDGYIYQTHYTHTKYDEVCTGSISTCSMAIQLNLNYLLEFALESPLPPGNDSFKTFTTADLNGNNSTVNILKLNTAIYNQYATTMTNDLSGPPVSRYVYYLPGSFCGTTCYQ